MSRQFRDPMQGFGQKERHQFQDMLRCYDNKEHKQGMKLNDNFILKYPDHPETLSMRALLLNGLNRQKEALEQIKEVLFKNLTNFTCWHVYGILSKNIKDFDQSRRAYLNALKYKPGDDGVMRDLSQLQIHLRDFKGFEETRRLMLVEKPNILHNWLVYAEACFVDKSYETVLDCITSIQKFDSDEARQKLKPHEKSEIYLMAVRTYEAMEDYQGGLKFIKKNRKFILDQVYLSDIEGRLFQKYGYPERAFACYETLLQLNSVNFDTYFKIIDSKGIKVVAGEKLSEEDQAKVADLLDVYIQGFPKVNAHYRVGLKLLHGDRFSAYLAKYVRPLLIKGVPSVMSDLKEFYHDEDKIERIAALFNNYRESMDKQRTLEETDEEEQDPTVYLWILYHQAQHHAFKRDLKKALELVDQAIEHTPTLLELYTFKGKVYEMAGDRKRAYLLFEEARTLDQADRAINAHAAEYSCKNNDVEKAEATMKLFTDNCGYDVNYHDNQTIWLEMRAGQAHFRNGDNRQALKQFNYVDRHIESMIAEQYDYYLYSMRKFTLKSFEEMIEMFDEKIFVNRFVEKSAIGYIKLQNRVDKIKETEKEAFKVVYQEYIESEEYTEIQAKIAKQEDDDEYRNDPDPKGYVLYNKILNDEWSVVKFVEKVAAANPKNALLQAKAVPVFLRHNKFDAALKAAAALHERHATYPRTVAALSKLFTHWNSLDEAARAKAFGDDKAALEAAVTQLEKLGLTADVEKFEADWFARGEKYIGASRLDSVIVHIKLISSHFKKDVSNAEQLATDALVESAQKDLRITTVVTAHRALKKLTGFKDETFKTKAKELFPHSVYFA